MSLLGFVSRLQSVFVKKEQKQKKKSEKSDDTAPILIPALSAPKQKHDETLSRMEGKIDELLEIKKLYEDMLDWVVELAKNRRVETSRESSRETVDSSTDGSILSPRLRQVLDAIRERGEANADTVSDTVGLSANRCSEILNALYRANYLEKNRAGREVYYRLNPGSSNRLVTLPEPPSPTGPDLPGAP